MCMPDACEDAETNYQNEGHVLWLPSHEQQTTLLTVRTHQWSKAHFVVLAPGPYGLF